MGYVSLMESCWHKHPGSRPSMKEAAIVLAGFSPPPPLPKSEPPLLQNDETDHVAEWYENGKMLMRNKRWIEAFKVFKDYHEQVEKGVRVREPHLDYHLLYLAICFHEAKLPPACAKIAMIADTKNPENQKLLPNVWVDRLCEWVLKYSLNLDERSVPMWLRSALQERKDKKGKS